MDSPVEADQAARPECPFSPDGRHCAEVSNPNRCGFCGAAM
ncbi:hypothetical protein [Actinophytocola sp.]